MNNANVEKMVNEIIAYLKRKRLWNTDTGIIYNGVHVTHKGTFPSQENLRGVARMWFEGTLYRIIYHGIDDPEFKVYNRLKNIMKKHGFYPEFGASVEFNIYPL